MATDDQIRRILLEIERGGGLSHRTIAGGVGLSLGLTNELLRELVRRRFVRVPRASPRGQRYELTPSGRQELARTSRSHLMLALSYYADARARVRHRLEEVAETWTPHVIDKRVVFFGGGHLAEIAYACVEEAGLRVVGIVDDPGGTCCAGTPVLPAERLSPTHLGDEAFDCVVVTSLTDGDPIRARLAQLGLSPRQVVWL